MPWLIGIDHRRHHRAYPNGKVNTPMHLGIEWNRGSKLSSFEPAPHARAG